MLFRSIGRGVETKDQVRQIAEGRDASLSKIGSISQQLIAARTEASRPNVIVPNQTQIAQAPTTTGRSQGLNRKPPVDFTQQAAVRQTSNS